MNQPGSPAIHELGGTIEIVTKGRVYTILYRRDPLQFGHLQRFLTAARLGFNISGGGGLNH